MTAKHAATALAIACLLTSAPIFAQPAPTTIEEVWAIVQQQQAEIDALRAEVNRARSEVATTGARIEETEARVEATGDFVETLASTRGESDGTTLGGYGELHYSQLDGVEGDSDEIDFHRFVLFFGHEFSERAHFFSEVELEHSITGEGAPGEVELEQAYVDFRLNDTLSTRTGLFLLPIGILNETHEPTTFYGVERNDVESIILPSTWWEGGASLHGQLGNGLSWDLAAHSGLAMPTTGGDAFRIRDGRQKVGEAIASDPAYTARLRYTGVPGLELAASYQYQTDPSQVPGDGLDSGQLLTAHAIYEQNGFGLRALYATWDFKGTAVEAAGADRQDGWYLEPSYRLNDRWGFYARYEDLDGARAQDQFSQTEFGFNFWPVDGVVLKMDYRDREHELPALSGNDFTAVDLGFGYAF